MNMKAKTRHVIVLAIASAALLLGMSSAIRADPGPVADGNLPSYRAEFEGSIYYDGNSLVEVKLDRNKKEDVDRLVGQARKALASAEEAFGKKAGEGSAREQFLLARLNRILWEALTGLDDALAANCHGKAIELAKSAYKQKHPGAAELLSQMERDPAKKLEYRKFGMEHGCATSSRLLAKQDILEIFPKAEEMYYFAFLDVLYSAWRGEYMDPLADCDRPLFLGLNEAEAGAMDDSKPGFHSFSRKVRVRAYDTFNAFRGRYCLEELVMADW